ncbi:hypothetical protein ACFVHW_02625 [Streptomyces sp. NPDC127110]|uniref:hypothetical protein n=1 Tax=Streptomyces sp. NPDC127110 TaxID=3345362 RepID=UPI0036328362
MAEVLEQLLADPNEGLAHPSQAFCKVIDHLMSPADALNEGLDRPDALRQLNGALKREGFEAAPARYGDWTGPAAATLIGVGHPARDAAREIHGLLHWPAAGCKYAAAMRQS